ncbi:MAG TPA: hypothetical protein VJI74_02925 [Candidatus Paceibacterota bacterium]
MIKDEDLGPDHLDSSDLSLIPVGAHPAEEILKRVNHSNQKYAFTCFVGQILVGTCSDGRVGLTGPMDPIMQAALAGQYEPTAADLMRVWGKTDKIFHGDTVLVDGNKELPNPVFFFLRAGLKIKTGSVLLLSNCCGQYSREFLAELKKMLPEVEWIAPLHGDFCTNLYLKRLVDSLVDIGILKAL